MDVRMDTSPSYFDPEDLTIREPFRRYGKRHSASSSSSYHEHSTSKYSGSRLLYDGHSIHSPTNAALLLENIKQEVESIDADRSEGTPARTLSASKRRPPIDSHGMADMDAGADSVRYLLKACKHEDDSLADGGDTTFTIFASLLDSAFQVSEELPKELILYPQTSHLEACQFVADDHTAQLCLRIVQWLEGLASKALDLESKVRGSHVGTYLPSSGVWHHTQRYLKKGASNKNTINHLDFDAPTREHAHQLPDDKKQDESLLEDVWTLLRAGRLEEACDLCRSAGQPWRAATLCPFGGLDLFPSVEAVVNNGKSRILQAIELESGPGHQWRLWKWASYCASEKIVEQDGGKFEAAVYAAQCGNLKRMLPICTDWESACWAMAKSCLDVQVDLELAHLQSGRVDQMSRFGDVADGSPGNLNGGHQPPVGSESWPVQVLNQQPRQLSALLQKLHSTARKCCSWMQRAATSN